MLLVKYRLATSTLSLSIAERVAMISPRRDHPLRSYQDELLVIESHRIPRSGRAPSSCFCQCRIYEVREDADEQFTEKHLNTP